MMYYCRDCGREFDEMEADYYQINKWSEEPDLDYENHIICPECGSLDIEEIADDMQE